MMVATHHPGIRPKPLQPSSKVPLGPSSALLVAVHRRVHHNEDTAGMEHPGNLGHHLFKVRGIVQGGIAYNRVHRSAAERRALEFPANSIEIRTDTKENLCCDEA